MRKIILLFTISFASISYLFAQVHHTEENAVASHSSKHKKHTVALYTAFTHIPGAFYENETLESRSGKFVPTIGFDYYYHLAPKLSVGLMTDFEYDDYYIHQGEEKLVRDNIWIAAVVGKYKISKYLEIFAGPGYEMERKKSEQESESVSLWLMRTGVEFIVPIEDDWSIAPSFLYDFKEEYHSYSFGLSIMKQF